MILMNQRQDRNKNADVENGLEDTGRVSWNEVGE